MDPGQPFNALYTNLHSENDFDLQLLIQPNVLTANNQTTSHV